MKLPYEKWEIGFVFFFGYMAVSSMFLGIYFDAPLSKLFSIARAGFYWTLIFYFGKNLFNREVFFRCLCVFSVTLSVYIIVQLVAFLLTGYHIPGYVLSAPLNDGGMTGIEMYEHSLQLAGYKGFIRPSGFLIEPAHCSQYLFVCLLTIVCDKFLPLSRKVLIVILISVAMIITQSATGLFLLSFAWIVFIVLEKKFSVFRVPLLVVLGFFSLFLLFGMNHIEGSALERTVNIIDGNGIDNSSNMRLNNGMNLFEKIPFAFKVFGTGAGLFEFVSDDFHFGDVLSYMNTFSSILFSTGFVGTFLWILSLCILFLYSRMFGRCLVIGMFIMSLGSSFYCQPVMVWFLLLMMSDIKEKYDRYPCSKLQ